jgi:hypothetical protein
VLHGASVVYICVRYHGLGFQALFRYSLAAIFACSGDTVGRYSLEDLLLAEAVLGRSEVLYDIVEDSG